METTAIEQLIPQRAPIKMVDALEHVNGDVATTAFTIRPDNIFLEEGQLIEAGLIEHIAQSALVFAGQRIWQAGGNVPLLGLLGEVKGFQLSQRPVVGDVLHTTITMGPNVGGVTLVRGKTVVDGEVIASTQMKVSF